jgi:heme A synthase
MDIGMSIALVLYIKLKKMRTQANVTFIPMNIVTFKMELVEALVGRWMDSQAGEQPVVVEHYLCTSKAAFAHSVLTVLCYHKHDKQDINA